jgi:hypothetical protein
VIVGEKTPVFEIVPVIAPVNELRVRPAGSDPDAIAQAEVLQLLPASVMLTGWPFVHGPRVAGVMEQLRVVPKGFQVVRVGLQEAAYT